MQWVSSGGAFDNLTHFNPAVRWDAEVDEAGRMLLFDPQTSGGLLLGVPVEKVGKFLARALELDQPAWVIGKVHAGSGIEVV
jgi:selenide,water dikinase